jgi:MoxR-like ATPase
MNPMSNPIYTGKKHPGKSGIAPYLPSDDLIEAVNLAIALNRPLLLEGDPGCGKTCLAEAVAAELGLKLHRWDVKSASRAKDGLYTYDAVGRLRDAQMLGANLSAIENFLQAGETKKLKTRLKNESGEEYVKFGAFGNAINESAATGKRSIILIDEVDKADGDFCNDLLLELDKYEFTVTEIGEEAQYPKGGKSQTKPIVILTSNREKPLPAPFLRRCLYFYVEFPTGDRLEEIIAARFKSIPQQREAFVRQAIEHIEAVRKLMQDQPGGRPPGTSEFLDLLLALWELEPKAAISKLQNLSGDLPLLGTLLKSQPDQGLHQKKFPSVNADDEE